MQRVTKARRRRTALTWILLAFTLVPIALLSFALRNGLQAASAGRDVNASGTLKYSSLWLYGATLPSNHPNTVACTDELRHMAAVRDRLMTKYPDDVAATNTAWTSLSDSFIATGHVDWVTAVQMETAADSLTQRIKERSHALTTSAAILLVAGIVTLFGMLAFALLLVRKVKQAEESDRRFTRILDASLAFVVMMSTDDRVLYMNQAYRDLIGIGPDDPVSLETYAKSHSPKSYVEIKDIAIPSALRDGRWHGMTTLIDHEGREVLVSKQIIAHRSEDGDVQYFSAIAGDVSMEQQAQNELMHSRERLQQGQALARVGSWEHDVRSNTSIWSDEMYKIFGLTRSEKALNFEDMLDLIHPDDRRRMMTLLRRAQDVGEAFDFEHRVVTTQGDFRYVHTRCQCLRDESGQSVHHLIGAVLDVTDRRFAEQENLRLAAIVESSEDAIMAITLDGIIVSWNGGAERLYGYSATEITGRHASLLTSNDEKRFIPAVVQQILRGQRVENVEVVRDGARGSAMHISLTFSPIKDTLGTIIGVAAIGRDITDRKISEEAFRSSETKLVEAQRIAKVGSWEFDPETRILTWSQEVFRMLGYAELTHVPTLEEWIQCFDQSDRDAQQSLMDDALANGVGYSVDMRLARSTTDGECWVHVKGDPVLRADGTAERLVGTIMDITERKAVEATVRDYADALESQTAQLQSINDKLAAIATEDGLTGLKNHRAFQERIAEEFTRARRYGAPLSVLMVDIDHFKEYNETHGHPAGDEVLAKIAAIIKSVARSIDIVARYGGEEFAVILPQTDVAGALATADRLRTQVESSNWPHGQITVSIGLSKVEPEMADHSELVTCADMALYEAKRKGRNRVYQHSLASQEDRPLDRAA